MTQPAVESSRATTRNRFLIAGAVAIAVGVAMMVALRGGGEPPATTVVAATSTTSPPTTTLGALLSGPFAAQDLRSHTPAVPDNPASATAALSIYVDPQMGTDSAPGTLEEPVATLEGARRLARIGPESDVGDVVVYLRGGIHPRTETFTLDAADSGSGDAMTIYRSFPGEQAIIEGGIRVDSWDPAFGDVMVTAVPESVAEMRQFFAGTQRQQRAISSGADGTALEFLRGPLFDRQRNVAMTVASDLVSDFSHPEDLELLYIGVSVAGHGITRSNGNEAVRPSWKSHRLPVTSASDQGNGATRLDIGNGALYHASERGHELIALRPGDPFFFENAIELLDEPGEWFFDSRRRLLYWWPADAAALDDAWIPSVEVLVKVDGTPQEPVRNIRFEGLAFRHSAYTTPIEAGYVVSQASSWFAGWEPAAWMEIDGDRHSQLDQARPTGLPGAAVQIDSASNVAFVGNVFTELGAAGVAVQNDVHNAEFTGNLFVDISAEALIAGHPEHDDIDEPMEGPITDLSFTNNVIDRAAAEFFGSVGVHVYKAGGAVISHNLFRDLPYSALSLGWGWDHNPASTVHRAITVDNNYFENVVNLLYDGAPFYLLGPVAEPGAKLSDYTQIRGNFVNNAAADVQFKAAGDPIPADYAKRPGVQLDKGIRNVAVVDNVFLGSTVWLQVTRWPGDRTVPGWIDELALVGSGNWSDTTASVPADTSLAGVDQAAVFDVVTAPTAVLEIAAEAGLEPGMMMPPLP